MGFINRIVKQRSSNQTTMRVVGCDALVFAQAELARQRSHAKLAVQQRDRELAAAIEQA